MVRGFLTLFYLPYYLTFFWLLDNIMISERNTKENYE